MAKPWPSRFKRRPWLNYARSAGNWHGMNADVYLASPAIDANIKAVKWLRGQRMTLTTFRLPLELCGKLLRPRWCTRRALPRWLICTVSCRFRRLASLLALDLSTDSCTLTQYLSIWLSFRVFSMKVETNLVWVVLLMFQIVPMQPNFTFGYFDCSFELFYSECFV